MARKAESFLVEKYNSVLLSFSSPSPVKEQLPKLLPLKKTFNINIGRLDLGKKAY